MKAPVIRTASAADESHAVAAIVTAFAADPAARWLYPDPEQYLKHFPDFVRAFGGKAFEGGTADCADGFGAAALWLAPGIQPDDEKLGEVLQRSLESERMAEMRSLFEQMGSFHPNEPHWYLPFLGVDPPMQGRGCGTALLNHGLARCDREKCLAYLESSNPRNISLYERFGFKALSRIRTKSSPAIVPMLRPPQ